MAASCLGHGPQDPTYLLNLRYVCVLEWVRLIHGCCLVVCCHSLLKRDFWHRQTCVCVPVCACLFLCVRVCVCVCVFISVSVFACLCVCVCLLVCLSASLCPRLPVRVSVSCPSRGLTNLETCPYHALVCKLCPTVWPTGWLAGWLTVL